MYLTGCYGSAVAYLSSRLRIPRVDTLFSTLLSLAREQYPDLRVRLVYDTEAGKRGNRDCARAYAYCACDNDLPRLPPNPDSRTRRHRALCQGYVIAVAPKIAHADTGRLQGILCHELAHAILLHDGDDTHTERDADTCAEQVFGVRIFYDFEDVQTCDLRAPGARRPRPRHLDDEDGFTKP